MLNKSIITNFDSVIKIIGEDSFEQMLQLFSGQQIYFPNYESFQRQKRNDTIKNQFTGDNFQELAEKYQLSDSQIRRIVNPKTKKI